MNSLSFFTCAWDLMYCLCTAASNCLHAVKIDDLLLFCRCAFFENNNCIQFTVCASLSDLDYLRKVETEPTKILMLDSYHQVRAADLMSVLMKVQDQVCNLSWYLLYSTIQPRARLGALTNSLVSYCMYSAFILWGPLSNLVNWHCGHCSGTVAWSLNMCRHCFTVKLFSWPIFLL